MEPKVQPVYTQEQVPPFRRSGETIVVQDQNRVLRNTYLLLAISMLPTIVGAWAGMQLNLMRFFVAAPIITPLVMFAVMLGSLFVVTRLRNSAWGIAALFGFTFIAGAMLTPILTVSAQFKNGGQLVALAGGMTAVVFFTMATIATVTKRDFSFMGKFLFVGLIMLIVASIANLFFAVPAVTLTISAIAVFIFSLYVLYDVSNIVRGGETNYIMATTGVFLSLFNIFANLLHLLMAFTGERD